MQFIVNLDVDDLDAAVDFYRGAFDLELGRRFGASTVELLGGSAPMYLLKKPAGTAPFTASAQRRSYDRHWTPVHLDFIVEEIESAVQRALGAGAALESPISNQVWGRLAMMADPFGHGFCLLQFLGHGYDELADAAGPT